MPREKGSSFRAELCGQKFNRLLVENRQVGSYWNCVCDCGQTIQTTTYQLKSGKTKSCGCYSRERVTTHGMDGTPTYNTWAHMLTRCRNVNHKQYPSYGGRGIKVCERWLSFEDFFSDMGIKPNDMSLDRIDNDGNYEPSNCRWATSNEQNRNRRVSPKYEWHGEIKSLADLADMHGLKWRRVYERMRSGWTLERALTTPTS